MTSSSAATTPAASCRADRSRCASAGQGTSYAPECPQQRLARCLRIWVVQGEGCALGGYAGLLLNCVIAAG